MRCTPTKRIAATTARLDFATRGGECSADPERLRCLATLRKRVKKPISEIVDIGEEQVALKS